MFRLDLIDKGILYELEADCRVTFQSLSRKFNLSANAIKRRVNKLLESGVIERFIIELSLAMLDADLVHVDIQTDGSEEDEIFIENIGNHETVRNVYSLTDGSYVAIANVSGSRGLSTLGKFLRGLKGVTAIEMHILIPAGGTAISSDSQILSRGNKTELSSLQLRVLSTLLNEPRMPIDEIAIKSGLTARRVRRVLHQIQEDGGVYFTCRWNWSAGGAIHVPFQLRWDENQTTPEDLVNWLREQYPLEFWYAFISATVPLMFCVFLFDQLADAEPVTRTLRKSSVITSVETQIPYPSRIYPSLGELRLKEMIMKAGFS